jgi:hypothetical protein
MEKKGAAPCTCAQGKQRGGWALGRGYELGAGRWRRHGRELAAGEEGRQAVIVGRKGELLRKGEEDREVG